MTMRSERRSAKQVVSDFANSSLLKIERGDRPSKDMETQLQVIEVIARRMNWLDLASRIDRALSQGGAR